MNVFIKPLEDYVRDIDPVGSYLKQMTKLHMLLTGSSEDIARLYVKNAIKDNGPNDPIVEFTLRNENSDITVERTKLTNYIKDSIAHNDILVPSFTSYTHPSIEESLHSEYMFENIKLRKADKKEAFIHEMNMDEKKALKDKVKDDKKEKILKEISDELSLFKRFNTLQKTRKIKNNGMSGAYGSKSTILLNPSAHYTLTSMTRTATSIANATTEHMSIGNRNYHSEDVVFNHLLALITRVDRRSVEAMIYKYRLHVPTPMQLYVMVRRSTDLYWENDDFNLLLAHMLNKLDEVERCIFMYTNDLFHLAMYNKDLVKNILKEMSEKSTIVHKDHSDTFKDIPGYIVTHVHGICKDEISGMNINYNNMDELKKNNLADLLVGTALHVNNTVIKYSDLFISLFRTEVMPPSIGTLRSMVRRVTVLSDTDSTCASYGHWVKFYKGEVGFTSEDVGISSAAMTIVTQVLEHHLRQYATNMNVPNDLKENITYKGEFFWTTMTPMEVSKHYYASVAIKEGNVYREEKLELKGVNLIASTMAVELQDMHKKMIKDINKKTSEGKRLDNALYVKKVAELEKMIIKAIKEENINIFKRAKIKEAEAYKNDEDKSNYFHHTLWKAVFEEKYGNVDNPPYTTIKINATTDTKGKMNTFLDRIEDDDIKHRLRTLMIKSGKTNIATFYLPLIVVQSSGIPKELKSIIDVNRIVSDMLLPFYMVLESIGFFRKKEMLLTEMGY